MEYTNVLIEFVPPILDFSDAPIGSQLEYFIKIKTPASNRPGVKQSIPTEITLPISYSEPLRLKLLPSDLYLPIGRYDVTYYQKGNKFPILEEIWVVPTLVRERTINLTGELYLPTDFYSAVSLMPNIPFEIRHNQLVLLGETIGKPTLTLTYQTAATRDMLVVP